MDVSPPCLRVRVRRPVRRVAPRPLFGETAGGSSAEYDSRAGKLVSFPALPHFRPVTLETSEHCSSLPTVEDPAGKGGVSYQTSRASVRGMAAGCRGCKMTSGGNRRLRSERLRGFR